MRGFTASNLFLVLLFFKEFLWGNAKVQHGARRGLKGYSIQRTTLSESDGEKASTPLTRRRLEDEPPCTDLFSTRKSKFNKFDDDWYAPCKTIETRRPTAPPTIRPSKTRPPYPLYSTTSPVYVTSENAFPESGPPLSVVMDQVTPKLDSPIVQAPTASSIFPDENDPVIAPSEAPIESEKTTVEVEIDLDLPVKEKGSSCLKAKAGHIFPTPVNFTIHYKYELLAKRDSNLTGVVWPEVDRAFQRFLSLTLIDCDIDVTKSGASRTFKSRLKSISPEPIDSVGSLYPDGWNKNISANSTANACSKILIDDELLAKRGLYCDVVTGSITLYLSEFSYMDTVSDPSVFFLEYRDEVFQFLRDEINEGGNAISNYFDDSLGIRGFHFLSESTNLNLKPISTIPDAASEEWIPFKPNEKASTTTVIAGSLTALFAFTLAAGVFALHRRKRDVDKLEDAFKQSRTPRMDDNEMEFYDIDNRNPGNTGDVDRSKVNYSEAFFARQGSDLNESQNSDDDVQTNQQSIFDENYDLNERSSQLSTSYDYSQVGVSMRLQSPDKNLSIHISTRPDPSIARTNPVGRKSESNSDMNQNCQGDEPSAPVRRSMGRRSISGRKSIVSRALSERKSVITRSSSEASVSSSKYVDSVKGSPALEYILALGSAYLSSPNKPFDEESTTQNQHDVESLSAESTSVQEFTIISQRSKSSLSSQRVQRDANSAVSPDIPKNKKYPVKKRNSPNSVTDFSLKTPPPISPLDDGSLIQSPMSSASESSDNSRVEYLKNRRKELEDRFQNYRRSLSESMDKISNSPSRSWLSSRELSRSFSLYKNSDQVFSSPSISSSKAAIIGADPKSSDSTIEEEQALIDSDSKHSEGGKSFEAILDNDDAWGIEPPEGNDEKCTIDKFLSSSSPKMRLEADPTRFQANTVIL